MSVDEGDRMLPGQVAVPVGAQQPGADYVIWTTAVHWEDAIQARELSFSGQEQIIPLLREYFDRFDYGPYHPTG